MVINNKTYSVLELDEIIRTDLLLCKSDNYEELDMWVEKWCLEWDNTKDKYFEILGAHYKNGFEKRDKIYWKNLKKIKKKVV
jgi:hypothetical protein